jgi:hypothetical protein
LSARELAQALRLEYRRDDFEALRSFLSQIRKDFERFCLGEPLPHANLRVDFTQIHCRIGHRVEIAVLKLLPAIIPKRLPVRFQLCQDLRVERHV